MKICANFQFFFPLGKVLKVCCELYLRFSSLVWLIWAVERMAGGKLEDLNKKVYCVKVLHSLLPNLSYLGTVSNITLLN